MFSMMMCMMWVFATIGGAIVMGWYQKFATTRLRSNRMVVVTRIRTKTANIIAYIATIIFGILLVVRSFIVIAQLLSNQPLQGSLIARSGAFMPFMLAALIYCYNSALCLAFNEASRIHEKMLREAISNKS